MKVWRTKFLLMKYKFSVNTFAVRFALPLVFVVLSAPAQTNLIAFTNRLDTASNAVTGTVQIQTNQSLSLEQRIQKVRTVCIQNRRRICGKILKVLPDGVVVDSGYTSLMRDRLNRSWLLPGTVVATRATNVVEENQPDSICIGLVFLTDLPKTPAGAKLKTYDYVNLEVFPAGHYTYTSVGDVQRTVRKFSSQLVKAIQWSLDEGEKQDAQTK